MDDNKFYPSLSNLIDLEKIPLEKLGFIGDGITNTLEHTYYRGLRVNVSPDGAGKFFDLILVSYNRFGFEVPGTDGLALVLNPGIDGELTSEIPITLGYNLEILKYINGFDLDSFLAEPIAFYHLILDFLQLDPKELLQELLDTFLDDVDDSIQEFIDHFNIENAESLSLEGIDPEQAVENLIQQIEEAGYNIVDVILEDFLDDIKYGFESLVESVEKLFKRILGEFRLENLWDLIRPDIYASINEIKVALEFPRKLLKPLDDKGEVIEDTNVKSALEFNVGALSYSTKEGLVFTKDPGVSFRKSKIGETGFTLFFEDAKVDLSKTKNIPEADAEGRSPDFRGIYIKEAEIGLPEKWFKNQPDGTTAEIFGENLLIGTGGFSGKIGLRATEDYDPNSTDPAALEFRLGGKEDDPDTPESEAKEPLVIGFNEFDITFLQNEIIESNVSGYLEIPGLHEASSERPKARIKIKAHFDGSGDFVIEASNKQGLGPFFLRVNEKDVFSYKMKKLLVGREGDRFFIDTAGHINFPEDGVIGEILTADIHLDRFRIWDDGTIEINGGGTYQLPETLSLPIGPATISVTAIHVGSHQQEDASGMRKYMYFGFDGGINVDPGGVDVRGSGVKYYFSFDNGTFDHFIRIDSIAIDLVIPGDADPDDAKVLIKGYLMLADPEYQGGVEIKIPKKKISGGANMRLNKKYPAWIVDAWLDLPKAIPLGSTGLGIYGFRGLVGQRYIAQKSAVQLTEENSWYDYYKAPPHDGVLPETTPPPGGKGFAKFNLVNKAENGKTPFAVGAGASIATMPDSGKVLSTKLFMLLSLPEMFFFEGRAKVLGEIAGLDAPEDPPFFAMLAIGDGKIEVAFGADFQLQEDGKLIDLFAKAEAGFYFKNPKAFYLNIGTKEDPNRARILSLFNADSYLMLSASGIKGGARVSFGFEKKYVKVVYVKLQAYFEVGGFISFERPQIGAYAALGGSVEASLFKIGFYIGLDATLGIEVPKPFLIYGSVRLCVGRRIRKCFTVEFKWDRDRDNDQSPIEPFGRDTNDRYGGLLSGVNIMSGETFPIEFLRARSDRYNINTEFNGDSLDLSNSTIPLDTWIDMEFKKGMKPSNLVNQKIGGYTNSARIEDYSEKIPPKPVKFVSHHSYTVEDVTVYFWHDGQWRSYHPYQALGDLEGVEGIDLEANRNVLASNLKIGNWQKTDEKYNKIRLLAQSPFSYLHGGEEGWYVPEEMGLTAGYLYCESREKEMHCENWENVSLLGRIYPGSVNRRKGEIRVRPSGGNAIVREFRNAFGLSNSLVFSNGTSIRIELGDPSALVALKLFTFSTGVEIKYYQEVDDNRVLIESKSYDRTELLQEVRYQVEDRSIEITHVEIIPNGPDPEAIAILMEELLNAQEELFTTPNIADDHRAVLEQVIAQKKEQIEALKKQGCVSEEDDDLSGDGAADKIQEEIDRLEQELQDCKDELAQLIIQYEECKTKCNEAKSKLQGCMNQLKEFIIPQETLDCLENLKLLPPDTDEDESIYQGYLAALNQFTDDINVACVTYYLDLKRLCREAKLLVANCEEECKQWEILIDKQEGDCDRLEELIEQLKEYKDSIGDGYTPSEGAERCSTYLHEVCWLTVEETIYNEIIPPQDAIEADYKETIDAIKDTLSPVWRPNTKYLVHFELSDTVNGRTTKKYNYYYGFQTAGPIGHFHDVATSYVEDVENPEYKTLTTLKPYIDMTKSYPNADGNLIGAKPLYYGIPEESDLDPNYAADLPSTNGVIDINSYRYKLNIFYVRRYVYHLLSSWPQYKQAPAIDGSLQVIIKDPAEDITLENPPVSDQVEVPVGDVVWVEEDTPWEFPESDTLQKLGKPGLWDESFEGKSCIEKEPEEVDPARPLTVMTQIIPRYLKPLKLYSVSMLNSYEHAVDQDNKAKEVHRYGFQTSQYANFREHIMSYQMEDAQGARRDAVYSVSLPAITGVGNMIQELIGYDVNAGIPADLKEKFSHPFDRLIEGVFGISALPPAVTFEINVVKDHEGAVIGLWLRSPEPFNDPKMSDEVLMGSIFVFDNEDLREEGASPDRPANRKLFSKDRSEVFISNDGASISDLAMRLKMYYIEWDGEKYVNKEMIETDSINLDV